MKGIGVRVGGWRQAVVTFAGVLPMSLVLNLLLDPLLRGWPPGLVVCVNAGALVAALNWVLLPVLHRVTRGWASRSSRGDDGGS